MKTRVDAVAVFIQFSQDTVITILVQGHKITRNNSFACTTYIIYHTEFTETSMRSLRTKLGN